MITFYKSLKRQDGFTLVELMVVVAIIGLLSAVAVPNFKKYQAKAKTSEAKLQLSAIYTAEQAFYSDYGIYANCLAYMGYDPSAEIVQRYYLTGFPSLAANITAGANTAYNQALSAGLSNDTLGNGGCPNNAGSVAGSTFFPAGKGIGTSIVTTYGGGTVNAALTVATSTVTTAASAAAGLGTQVDQANQAFRAVAVGIIDGSKTDANGNSSALWINQNKQIANPRSGY
jgi:type IV pilus assembly protein PilA